MNLLLLKTILLRKRKDEGFTLPIVMAIGMVMVLLSTVSLIRSGEENLNALSQSGSSDALAAAELGVARYRDLLINNRVLAVNDLANWTNININTQTCAVISDAAGGWADTTGTAWRDIELDEPTVGSDLNSDGDMVDNDVPIGSYRLVGYEYDQNPLNVGDDNDFDQVADANNDFDADGNSDAVGWLTVQGRDTTGSIAQVRVTIPLGVNTQDMPNLNPALWIEQDSPASINNNINVNGANIVYKRDGTCSDPTDVTDSGGTDQNTISDARDLPPIFDVPSWTHRGINGTINTNTGGTDANYFDSSDDEIILGTPNDDAGTSTEAQDAGDDYYHYEIDGDGDLDAGEKISSDGVSRVILYVSGDLTIDTEAGKPTFLANTQFPARNSDIARFFEIHVVGNVNIQGDGNLDITGLLRVDGTVNITGSPTVNVIGAIWANNWNDTSSGTINITADNLEDFSMTPERTPAPITFRPSGWETQEAI